MSVIELKKLIIKFILVFYNFLKLIFQARQDILIIPEVSIMVIQTTTLFILLCPQLLLGNFRLGGCRP